MTKISLPQKDRTTRGPLSRSEGLFSDLGPVGWAECGRMARVCSGSGCVCPPAVEAAVEALRSGLERCYAGSFGNSARASMAPQALAICRRTNRSASWKSCLRPRGARLQNACAKCKRIGGSSSNHTDRAYCAADSSTASSTPCSCNQIRSWCNWLGMVANRRHVMNAGPHIHSCRMRMNYFQSRIFRSQIAVPILSSPSGSATTACRSSSLHSSLEKWNPVRTGDERFKKSPQRGQRDVVDALAAMRAIASTGAMLFTGHKGTSGKSALARRTKPSTRLANTAAPRQVSPAFRDQSVVREKYPVRERTVTPGIFGRIAIFRNVSSFIEFDG